MSMLSTANALLCTGELFAAATLAMLLARFAVAQVPTRASLRHLIWLSAFATLLLLPLLVATMPGRIHLHIAAPAQIVPVRVAEAVPTAAPGPVLTDMVATPAITDTVSAAKPFAAAPVWPFGLDTASFAFLAAVIWLIGFAAVAARGLAGWMGLEALRAIGERCDVDHLNLPACLHRCDLRLSAAADEYGPITFGVLRPVVLLPRDALDWPQAQLEAVLLHELAHVRRGDSLWQMLAYVACALYWPNPFVWLGARALRREAEMAADDGALAWGLKPSSYARVLLDIAAGHAGPQLVHAPLAMAAPSSLTARIAAILSPQPLRTGVTMTDIAKIAASVLIASAAIAFARPSLAQDVVSTAPVATDSTATAGGNTVVDTDTRTNTQTDTSSVPPPRPDTPAVAPLPPVPATPALPAEAAMPAIPPAPPAPAERSVQIVHVGHGGRVVEIIRGDGKSERRVIIDGKDIDQTVAEAMKAAGPAMAQAMAEMRRQGPDMEKAMAEIRKARPQLEKAMAEVRRQQPEIRKAMAQMREELARANVNMKIEKTVDKALGRTEIRITIDAPNDKADGAHDNK